MKCKRPPTNQTTMIEAQANFSNSLISHMVTSLQELDVRSSGRLVFTNTSVRGCKQSAAIHHVFPESPMVISTFDDFEPLEAWATSANLDHDPRFLFNCINKDKLPLGQACEESIKLSDVNSNENFENAPKTRGENLLSGVKDRAQVSRCTVVSNEDAIRSKTLQKSFPRKTYDVICGRSKLAFNNIGNRRFRIIISLYLKRYLRIKNRSDRSKLIDEIVNTVHSAGGQFLKETRGECFVEIDREVRRNKVGHALRDAAALLHRSEERERLRSARTWTKKHFRQNDERTLERFHDLADIKGFMYTSTP